MIGLSLFLMNQIIPYLNQEKIFAHLDRLKEWLNKGETKPITVEIDSTNLCNYNCPTCSGNRYNKDCFLSLDFMKGAIKQISSFCKGLVFTGGGEPLLNKDTVNAVLFAKKKGLDIGFITNGSLLNSDVCKDLVKACTWIRISFDSENSRDYSKIHGVTKEGYDFVLNNIKMLVKIKKDIGSSCVVGVGYLTNKKSSKKMFSFAKKMKMMGVDYIQFRPFHYDNFNVSKRIKDCKRLESEGFRVEVSQHRYDKVIGNYPVAYRDEFSTVIAADGKLYPCCFTRGKKEFILGDLHEKAFMEIWKSKNKKEVFKNKLKMKNCPVMCRYDKLSQILWEIFRLNKEGKHLNFV